jgi:hypothetical protein
MSPEFDGLHTPPLSPMNARPGADWRIFFIRTFLLMAPLMVFFTTSDALTAQCTLVCNSGIQVSLPASGQLMLTPSLFAPTSASLCPGTLELTVWEGPGQILPNNIATCDQVGQTLLVRVRHLASGNLCESEVLINDLLKPVLNCPLKFINCADDPNPALIGMPDISDNCTSFPLLNITFFDNVTQLSCGTLQNGIPVRKRINRVWQVSDLSANQSNCLEQIWLQASSVDSVVFPLNLDDFAAPALSCGQNPENLLLTGQPLLFGFPIDNAGPCEMGVTHADQKINGCSPGSYTILRTWTVIDFCTNQTRQRIQIIKLKDGTPPTLMAPSNITVGADETVCSGTLMLPPAVATDLCSIVTVAPFWSFGSGYGPFTGVPEGNHIVTYQATDACGNTATATCTVTVADDDPPQVICVTSLQISLGSNGQALVNAAALDAGSWDNCGVIFKAVSRNDISWANTTTLTCQDEGVPVTVKLRISDASGLTNFCEVQVTARDFLKPIIACPSSTAINCSQYPANIAVTGQPLVTDNCTVAAVNYTDVNDLSICNTGTILRKWTAIDQSGNTKTCEQTITVTPFPLLVVSFPANITLNGCSGSLTLAPSATGSPLVSGSSCFPPSITFTDQVFNIAVPACFVVMRTWKIIDQCNYSPNGGNTGFWEQVQQINVTDQSPPDLVIPVDLTVSSGPSDCNAWVNLPDAVATDCSPAISITHNGTFASAGANASGWYPSGEHLITYTAADGCGNVVQRTQHILVADLMPPTALCISGLAVNLTPGGWTTVTPSSFNGGSTDNCSSINLTYAISPQGFSCQHIGQQQVILTVTDDSGNTAECKTYVLVQDNQQVCGRHSIEGVLHTPEGIPVGGINITNGQGDAIFTDSMGRYRFDSLLPGKNYIITPYYNQNWLNGVSAYDFVLISRHILGLQPINTPEKIIAADVNNSGSVTIFDIVQLRKVLLGTTDSVPGGKSWRFIPATFIFLDPANPFGLAFPESVEVTGLDSNLTGLNFVAIKLGDIDNSVDPGTAFSSAIMSFRKMMDRILRNLANDY